MANKIKALIQFLKTDIWRLRRRNLPKAKGFIIHHVRIILLSLRGFAEDKCQLRASALTYFSLLSIVPVFAMAFGIAKGFGFEKTLEETAMSGLKGQEEVLTRVIEFARTLLENTSGGLVAGVGLAVLFWTVIKVLGNIENAFNDIWGIKTARVLIRKFSDYLSIMLICPILLIASSSATVFIQSQITSIVEKISILGFLGSLILFAINFMPYCVLWIVFSFIYIVMPNTKVNIGAGIFAGITAGTIYQLWQWAYINLQIGASKFGAIYGSFAALPLFLMWLQVSWLIVLLGAEFSFAHQNVDTYELEPDCQEVSPAFKKLLSLRIVHLLVKRFTEGSEPLIGAEIAHQLEMPIRLARELLFDLVQAGILIEVRGDGSKVQAYQPAQDPERFTIAFVLETLDKTGNETLPLSRTPELEKIESSLNAMRDAFRKMPQNALLKTM